MEIFTIYQNDAFKKHHKFINNVGFGDASKKHLSIAAALKLQQGEASEQWQAEMFQYYKPVATVVVYKDTPNVKIFEQLERVFAASNCHPLHRLDGYTNFGKAHSLSVGDIVRTESGSYWIVNSSGFEQLEL